VISGGSGYLAAPWIDISGGAGAGATAVADLEDGVVKGITITHAGNDFLSPPTVTVMGGGSGKGLVLGVPVLRANTSGGVVKSGEGTLTLSGNNSYSGPTQVRAGELRLTSQIAGAVQVASGAAFGGRGSVGSLAVAPGGRFSPDTGNILDVRGNTVIQGALILEINAAGAGRVDTGGRLDLTGAKLAVTSTVPSGSPAQIIASYGSLEGKFATSELPPGYTLEYHHNGQNQIALLAPAAHPDDH
jgi:autotransporter-associated beta strand protein